ncbi:lytic transglycosylase domain-containing protein [Sphingobium sp. YC-XJ3]|jgi:soluble lytic murein transglycosylase-like protein|uniref:lytic transglycosylase domain-containing protein n=1 Tax=Sphingobium sp. YC-XJ3 TaxID=3024245 RepID=UPI00235FF8DF|nr:lytic transglycosylase domain-containing protein [Sphingobium sp. YC-XJ3]WDA39319.1 lytic transglycosylase domain-containing protein [Sphingobium sp. YC-XJ3]
MGPLKALTLALALATTSPARADTVSRWQPYIAEASRRFGIPPFWIERVMRAESRGLTMLDGRPITSRAGAMGLMQLMPATWAEMRRRWHLGRDPHDPRDNILAGTAFLRLMYDRFGYPGLFGAYNVGPGRYAAHPKTGRPLPGETRAYLATVGKMLSAGPREPIEQRTATIFFALQSDGAESPPARDPDQPKSPFIIRSPR